MRVSAWSLQKQNKEEIQKGISCSGPLLLCRDIAKKFENTGVGIEDLISIGTIGLMKAIDNFDVTQNVKFSTYAVPMIIGEVRRYLRDNNAIRVLSLIHI